jgi:CMP/dCMP kinase
VARLRTDRGIFYAKLRADLRDGADRERWALETLDGSIAPKLVHATSVRGVLSDLAERGERRRLRALDVGGGALLVLAEIPGQHKSSLAERDLSAAARALAVLHKRRTRRGPPLSGGATPPAMAHFTGECLALLERRGELAKRALGALGKRFREAARRVSDAWWELDGSDHAICHGDVRLANLLFEGDRARLLDFELAGIADPAIDLLRFVVHAELTSHQELCLLDAYAEAIGPKPPLRRYFAGRPIAALFGALASARYLSDVAASERRVISTEYVAARTRVVEARLSALAGEEVVLDLDRARRRARITHVVAVDGMAGSGKTPIASRLARRLGVPHLNTGALYRAATLLAFELGLDPKRQRDVARLIERIRSSRLELTPDGAISIAGRTLSASLDLLAIEESVAAWAKIAEVRRAVRPIIDRALELGPAVVEGRDVKSVLVPSAKAFYVEVGGKERAALVGARSGADARRLLKALAVRDRIDRSRSVDPAIIARGSMRVKGGPDVEGIVDRMIGMLGVR